MFSISNSEMGLNLKRAGNSVTENSCPGPAATGDDGFLPAKEEEEKAKAGDEVCL